MYLFYLKYALLFSLDTFFPEKKPAEAPAYWSNTGVLLLCYYIIVLLYYYYTIIFRLDAIIFRLETIIA